MSPAKRIALNTLVTYGRSIFGILCGVFSARWVLEALGHEDFGLYAVVGGMGIFVTYFNIQFAGAVSRYYAFSIGQANSQGDRNLGINECRSWFTTAVLIHVVLPTILILCGWPLGLMAMRYGWVLIPAGRIEACCVVWHLVCVVSFVGMVSVPFQAMYTAKQYIAELTIYSFLQTLLKTAFIYYMTLRPGEWLVGYQVGMMLVFVLPQLAICVRAVHVFEECRIVTRAFKEWWRVRNIACYASWTAIGGLGYIASHQGMGILINNLFGAKITSGFGVAQTMSSEAASLTGALQGAFQPAITTAYGEGDEVRMRVMALQACKIGTLLTFVFALPLAIELDTVLQIWLKDPPPYASSMSLCALVFIVIEKLSSGHLIALNAVGKIAGAQTLRGILRSTVIFFAFGIYLMGLGANYIAASLPLSVIAVVVGDVWMARSRAGLSFSSWIKCVLLPFVLLACCSIGPSIIPSLVMKPSVLRIVVTGLVSMLSVVVACWGVFLQKQEKDVVMQAVIRGLSLIKVKSVARWYK